METPEGETLMEWIKRNRVLNLDVDSFMSRGTLLFLQFNNLMNKVDNLETKIIRLTTNLEQTTHMLREIKRRLSV